MESQITDKQWWLSIDGNSGTDFIPSDLFNVDSVRAIIDGPEDDDYANKVLAIVRDYTENTTATTAELIHGYGVRLSAPGYLDCTAWEVFSNKREATRRHREMESEE
jgi:hypothetical protein